jgi:hypothetical protein
MTKKYAETSLHLGRGLLVLAVAVAAATFGCGGPSTSVTQTWKAQAPSTPPMRSILVFGAKMDETNRRAFEDAFVRGLAAHGVAARASYELFPGQLPDRDTAKTAAERAGFDGILVATSKGSQEVTTYVPNQYPSNFWGYYGATGMDAYGYAPGYVTTTEIASLETTLWDRRADEGKLVWSASTRTASPSPGEKFTKSVVDKVLPEIERAGFIPPGGK